MRFIMTLAFAILGCRAYLQFDDTGPYLEFDNYLVSEKSSIKI